ncbi:peptidylprolyl isomerase [Streptomyces sp. NPDC001568]|uniref:peptidylprolyl isomerase n=1 Tax=Streptomyces sp. NPDC001568 TaxID=3364588 RepID=UPI0036C47B69
MRPTPGVTSTGRRAARAAAGACAALAACSGLVWAALTLTDATPDDPAAPAPCAYTATRGGKGPGLPPAGFAGAARPYTADLVTNRGTVTIEVLTAAAPCAAHSFAHLARKAYFAGGACHRLTTSGIFVLECGDPAGGDAGGPGYSFPDENLTGAAYPAGTVALSKAAPGRNGSRFFLGYADPAVPMDPAWTPFAKVVGGLDVLRRIAANGTADGSTDGPPARPVVLESVTVHRPPGDR